MKMKKDLIQAVVVGGVIATATTVGINALRDKKTRDRIAKATGSVLDATKKRVDQVGKKAVDVSDKSQELMRKTAADVRPSTMKSQVQSGQVSR